MKGPRWRLRCAAVAVAGCTVAATAPLGAAAAQSAAPPSATPPGPTVKLITAQNDITVQRYGPRVYLDPGVYVVSLGSALQFDVRRASYTKPLTITQVIHLPNGGTATRPLPARILHGFSGLRNFLHISVADSTGTVVASQRDMFCPNVFDPQRATPNSPATSPYPFGCVSDPFQLGMVWGIQKGWGADPVEFSGSSYRLKLGTYQVTAQITNKYRKLLNISAANATAHVTVTVVKGTQCCSARQSRHHRQGSPLPRLPHVATLNNPPSAALPDLVPLPSWGIQTFHLRATKTQRATDELTFGATVWIGGTSQLDVQGFRSNGSPIMKAYQYFWRNGHVIGRARAGTMGFEAGGGHNHWHFKQFAMYQLLNSAKTVAVKSHKQGFCIAPSDAVNLLLPGAVWQPPFTGFFGGACGSSTALSVREDLPVGWGDTYFQFLAGQAFSINNVPNGTYYIEVIANPEKVLHESNYGNDISLRKVILGGTKGHRTVRVPAFHGIDPEH